MPGFDEQPPEGGAVVLLISVPSVPEGLETLQLLSVVLERAIPGRFLSAADVKFAIYSGANLSVVASDEDLQESLTSGDSLFLSPEHVDVPELLRKASAEGTVSCPGCGYAAAVERPGVDDDQFVSQPVTPTPLDQITIYHCISNLCDPAKLEQRFRRIQSALAVPPVSRGHHVASTPPPQPQTQQQQHQPGSQPRHPYHSHSYSEQSPSLSPSSQRHGQSSTDSERGEIPGAAGDYLPPHENGLPGNSPPHGFSPSLHSSSGGSGQSPSLLSPPQAYSPAAFSPSSRSSHSSNPASQLSPAAGSHNFSSAFSSLLPAPAPASAAAHSSAPPHARSVGHDPENANLNGHRDYGLSAQPAPLEQHCAGPAFPPHASRNDSYPLPQSGGHAGSGATFRRPRTQQVTDPQPFRPPLAPPSAALPPPPHSQHFPLVQAPDPQQQQQQQLSRQFHPFSLQSHSQMLAPPHPSPRDVRATSPPPALLDELYDDALARAEFEFPRFRVTGHLGLPPGAKVLAGEQICKSWEVQNCGRMAWPPGCRLFYWSERQRAVPLPGSVVPELACGATGTLEVRMRLPEAPGAFFRCFGLLDPEHRVFYEEKSKVQLDLSLELIGPVTPPLPSLPGLKMGSRQFIDAAQFHLQDPDVRSMVKRLLMDLDPAALPCASAPSPSLPSAAVSSTSPPPAHSPHHLAPAAGKHMKPSSLLPNFPVPVIGSSTPGDPPLLAPGDHLDSPREAPSPAAALARVSASDPIRNYEDVFPPPKPGAFGRLLADSTPLPLVSAASLSDPFRKGFGGVPSDDGSGYKQPQLHPPPRPSGVSAALSDSLLKPRAKYIGTGADEMPHKSRRRAGSVGIKSWILRNSGATAWPAETYMSWISGTIHLAEPGGRVPVLRAKPGEDVEVRMAVRLPDAVVEGEKASGYFRLACVNEATGEVIRFGPRLWVNVTLIKR